MLRRHKVNLALLALLFLALAGLGYMLPPECVGSQVPRYCVD